LSAFQFDEQFSSGQNWQKKIIAMNQEFLRTGKWAGIRLQVQLEIEAWRDS
jgi:hypothetical protein